MEICLTRKIFIRGASGSCISLYADPGFAMRVRQGDKKSMVRCFAENTSHSMLTSEDEEKLQDGQWRT